MNQYPNPIIGSNKGNIYIFIKQRGFSPFLGEFSPFKNLKLKLLYGRNRGDWSVSL